MSVPLLIVLTLCFSLWIVSCGGSAEAKWQDEVTHIIERVSEPASLSVRDLTVEDLQRHDEALSTALKQAVLLWDDPFIVSPKEMCEALLALVQLRTMQVPEIRESIDSYGLGITWEWFLEETARWCIPMPSR